MVMLSRCTAPLEPPDSPFRPAAPSQLFNPLHYISPISSILLRLTRPGQMRAQKVLSDETGIGKNIMSVIRTDF